MVFMIFDVFESREAFGLSPRQVPGVVRQADRRLPMPVSRRSTPNPVVTLPPG
jgi:hypothetical protein